MEYARCRVGEVEPKSEEIREVQGRVPGPCRPLKPSVFSSCPCYLLAAAHGSPGIRADTPS